MTSTKKLKGVSHVIFDLDGLILDTEKIYTAVANIVLGRYGKSLDLETKLSLMGFSGPDMAKRIVKIYQLPLTPEEYYEEVKREYQTVMPDCQLLPGAARLIKHLHNNEIPIAIATSSSNLSYELKTRKHKEILSNFHHVVCGGSDPDVKNGKPAPDIFLVCASRFPEKPKPEDCLVFEDAPNGIDSALAAGMQTIMVPSVEMPKEIKEKAHVVIESLEEAPLELFGLPAMEKCL
nr:unnamed protein product [Callosobruchus chinensis]